MRSASSPTEKRGESGEKARTVASLKKLGSTPFAIRSRTSWKRPCRAASTILSSSVSGSAVCIIDSPLPPPPTLT